MTTKALTAIAVAVASTGLFAQETYNIEAGVAFVNYSADDATKQTSTMIGGTYYFKPIKIDMSQPQGELEFLQKASGVTVNYIANKYEDNDFTKTSLPGTSISGRFYIDSLVAEIGYDNTKGTLHTKSNTARYVDTKANASSFGIGYLVRPNSELGFRYSDTKYTYNVSAGLTAINDKTKTDNEIYSHSVYTLSNGNFAVADISYKNIETKQTSTKKNHETSANFRYYPQTKIYVEAGLKFNSGDDKTDAGRTTSFGLGYAFTPRLAGLVQVANFSVKDSAQGADNKLTLVGVQYRF